MLAGVGWIGWDWDSEAPKRRMNGERTQEYHVCNVVYFLSFFNGKRSGDRLSPMLRAKLHLIKVKNAAEFLSERCQTRQQSIRQQGKHYTRQRGAHSFLRSKQGTKLFMT